jgi:hypothetical protein
MRATVSQLCLTVLVCIASAAPAQQWVDTTAGQPATKPEVQSSKQRSDSATQPQPGPEIERLVKTFSGTWSIAIEIEPSERMPKGGGGQGEEVWRPGPGGLSLIEEYHSSGDEGELSGLGVAWWNKDEQRYQVMWCNSSNPAGCIVMKHGAKWEGNQVVAEDESEIAGRKFRFKEAFADITENSFTQTLYQGELGSDLKRLLTITATRKKLPRPQPDVFTPKSLESQVQSLKMPGPTVQNSMLGTWSLTLKYEPSAEIPNGATGSATEVWWTGPGGYSVIEEYYQNDANEHLEEFIPNWWDSQARGQRFLYCANTLPESCQLSKNAAKWQDDRNVYTEEREEGGKKMTAQEIFEDISPNSFTQIAKEGESGKALKPTLTIHASKVSAIPH